MTLPTADDLGNMPEVDDVTTQQQDLDPEFLKTLVDPAVVEAQEQEEHDKKGYIPKGRFDEKNEEAKALAIENAALKAALDKLAGPKEEPAVQVDPLDEMEDKVTDLFILAQAAEKDYGLESTEYRDAAKAYTKANRQLSSMESARQASQVETQISSKATQAEIVKNELLETASAVYEVYPFMDVNSEDANDEAINKVIQLRDAYTKTGLYTPAKALQEAVDLIAPSYLASYKPTSSTAVADIRDARAKAEREKAAKANNQQPGFVKGRTEETGFSIDVENLTEKDMASLSKKDLDVLLGNR
jgi:hypothetical protein